MTYAMEPLLPDVDSLAEAILDLAGEARALDAMLPDATRTGVRELLRTVNTYHSNLIEGHDTRPRDILRAMAGDYARDPERRALQLEARAHVEVQRLLEGRLAAEPALQPTEPELLAWIHREFYARMPEEYRRVSSRDGGREPIVVPGAWRDEPVSVGRHLPPPPAEVPRFLARFAEGYRPDRITGPDRIAAIPASHHRLLWIHPFLDGNGRVARLFTDAYLGRAGLGGGGMWSASRGLARNRARYLALLDAADAERWDDYDGRGARSRRALTEFCAFFLDTCLDQVRYMRRLLDPAVLSERMRAWTTLRAGTRLEGRPRLAAEAWRLLDAALRWGEVPRGEAARLLGVSERTGRRVLATLLAEGLLVSSTPKGPVRLAYPAHVLEYFFPLLAPS